MKNLSSIRIFFLICLIVCIGAFILGYVIHSQAVSGQDENLLLQNRELDIVNNEDDQQVETEEENSLESLKVLNAYEYILVEEDGYIAVYYADKKTLYSETDIRVEGLEQDLQTEIQQGKYIFSVEELYNFLENHSS